MRRGFRYETSERSTSFSCTQERCLTTKTSVVSRSRRLQFHPSEATDGELPPASTSDIVMRRQGSVQVRLLASEDDESEKENLAEESRRRRERPKKGGERSSWTGKRVSEADEEDQRVTGAPERAAVDGESPRSEVVEGSGRRRALVKGLERSSNEEDRRLTGASVDSESSSAEEIGRRSSREKRVLERSSVDDSGSSVQKVVGESDREVLERSSVDSGSSMSGVVEEGDRRTLAKVLKRSSVEESDRVSLQERVLERSSVDSGSSVQKAVEESDREVLERPSVDSGSSMSGVVEEGDRRTLAKVLKRSSVDNESSVDESGHRSSREKRVLERSSVDSRSSVQKAVEESDRKVLERPSVDSGSPMSGVMEEGDRRSLAKVLKRSSVDNESSVEESDRRSSSQAGVLQRSAIDNESLVTEALQGRSSTRAPERSSRDNDSPKTESVRKGHFSTDAPERTSIGEPPMSEARGTSVRSPAFGQAVGGESDRRSSAASEDDQRRTSAEVVKGESVRRSSARALETSSRDEDGFGAASRILRDRSNLNDPETRSGGRADRSPAVEKRGLPVTPSLRRAVRQLSDSVSELTSAMQAVGHTPALQSRDDIIEQYVVTTDYTPLEGSEVGSIALREGQIVEVVDSDSKYKWLVRTRPSKYLSPRQGWIPSSYLEKKTAETTLRTLHNIMDAESDIRSDSKEREAATKRRAIVKELVDTEDEFVNDMQHVVHTYLKEMDNPRMPKELRDQRESLFLNFQEICDFHNNVLIKGVQYYAGEPSKLGKTFLRLERDFDMHAKYCQEEPKAQDLFSTAPVKEYFQEYSKRIGEIDKNLSDHLKLPIQRINDYQLLLKELIKYTSRLGEDCADLQKALDLMLSIPQRAHDLKYINSIEGFRGNIQKLGRLLRHQDWFTVTDAEGRSKERYLFLFRSRIFVTKVRKVTESRPVFILKDIVKLDEVEVKDTGAENAFEFHHKVKGQAKYPLKLVAQTEAVKEAWLKELGSVVRETAELSDLGEDAETEVAEEGSNRDASESEEKLKITEITDEDVEEREEKVIAEARRTVKFEEDEEKPRVEVLENFEAYEELNTVMTESVQSGSVNSVDANEYEDGGKQPRFRKPLKATTCIHGDTATLECELQAVPPATVTWLKDNVPLAQSEKVQSVSKGNSSYLVVKNAEQEDSGLYLCKASNAHGTASCSAQLNVQEPLGEATAPSPSPKAPQFAIKFKDTELLEGTSVRFLIKIHPEGTVKFLKNDRPLKEDDRVKFITEDQSTYELAIGHVTKKDDGKYTCVASNSVGENSFSALVKVSSEKDLFPGIQDVPVLADGSLKKGEQPDFKWFKGGQEIETCERFKVLFKDEEDSLALVFQHVTPEDAGLYTCVASTSSGRISCSAELSVEGAVKQLLRDPEAPQITCNLTDTEVSEGASAMLDLKVTGYPKPKLSWLKDGTEVKSGGRFKFLHEDDESMALIIKSVAYGDAGVYTVKAKNDLGEVSTSGHLLVKAPPKFKKQLKDVSVMTNEPAKFEVEVEGQPAPEVTWYKDGQVVKESDRVKISAKKDAALLEIKKVVPEDAGSYSCVATNTSGKISEFATLTVNDPPKFLKELKSLECKEAETIKFEAKVSGSPEPNIKWLFNGEEIKADGSHVKIEKDDRNHSLTVSKATRKDAGKYTLSISSDIGSASSSGDLTVNSLPAYVKGLSNVDVKEGESDFRLEVKVSGYPEPKIRWFIESMEIDEKSKKYKIAHEGETRALIIKQVDTECAGTYSCTISNAHGEASTKGTVNVLTKPNFAEKLKDAEFTEQSDVSYSVKVTGNPTPNLKWYKDNQEVNVSATVKVSKLDEGGCCSLTLTKVTEEFAGQYECRASNTEGDAVTISRLVVNTHPRFECDLKDVVVWNGMDAVIEAVGTAIPAPEVKWYKDGELLVDIDRVLFEEDGKFHRVHIANTVTEDSGVFKIELKNKLGEMSQEGRLTVKASNEAEEPVLMKKLQDVVCVKGNHAHFEAKIFANPEPEIHWYKDGKELTASDRVIVSSNNIKQTHSLTVKNVSEEDAGTYSVGAKNANGEISSQASLDVQVPPVIQEIKDKKAMPGSSVSFETKVVGKPKPSFKWLKGTVQLVEGDKVKLESDEVNGVYKLHLKGLTPEDSGEYACSAENVAGTVRLPFNLNVTTEAPHFIKGLHDAKCKLNNPVKLEVQVYGLPMPGVKWFKGDSEIEEGWKFKTEQTDERNFSLTIDKFCGEDAVKYVCKAFNQAGEAVTHCELALKHALPEFLKHLPKEVCIIDGEPFVLEAKLDNNPMPEIKWMKDGKEIAPDDHVKIEQLPDGTVKLSVEDGIPEDRGKYTLVATNEDGQDSSSGQVVVEAIPKAPKFLKKLEDTTVPQGKKLKLVAKVTAHPRPSVKWLKNGKPVKLDARTRLLEEPGGLYALEIDDVRPEDEAKYTLQVANHRGEASSDADVIVTGPVTAPEFLQGLKPVSATDGAPCRLEAKVGGKPLPTCKWFKDGEPFSPDGERVKAIARPDGTVALLFEKTEPKDAGKYSLEATNPHGSATSEGGLSVAGKEQAGERNKAPAFVVPLRDITVDEGKPIRLQAQIEGNPYPDVSWTKDGEPLKMNDSLFFVCEGNKIGLEVRKAAPGDAGRYECTLTNPEGKASSKADAAVTKLFTAPGFTQKTSDMFALPGSDPRFVCKVHGFPKPDVTWFFNDRPIEHDSNKYKLRRDGDMCVLQVKGATPEDRGTYRCKATNDAGEAECAAKLDVTDMGEKKDRAEPPSFLKKLGDCSLMEGMTAKFTACVAGFPEPTFKWYKNGSELTDSDKSKFQVEPHGLLRLVIKGATACDVGDYALKISNPHGEAESKARLVFDTYEDKKPRERKPDLDLDLNRNKRPVDDDDSGRGRNKNLDGDLNKLKRPGDDDADGRPRVNGDYDGRPDIKMSDRNGDLDTLKKPKEDGLDKKPKDKMLDLNVDYEKFRRSAIPLALPDKPIISKMSDRRLTLSWKPCIPIGPSVPVTYIVDMCEVPNGEWFPARSGIRGCCCEIRNLEPFRDYKFRVRVENKYGISDPSPYAVTYRQKLEMTPPKQLPRLPPELDFRMDTSPYFPKDYDIDRPPHEEYAHAPRFLRQTDDTQYGIKGEPASVEWYVYGYPTPVVSFLFKDQVVPMGGHYESIIARNGQCKLYLSRMMDKDVGIYECIAVNEHGEARQRINLAIAEHPVFTMHLDEESIMLRKSGVLQCRVVGVPYPNVKWYKDWHPIVSSNRIKIEWKEPDLCTLTISDAINKDGGMYSCGARNIAGMATTSAMVTIEENEDDYALLKYSHSRVVRAHPRPMEDAYDIGDELGRGTQGITYHAVERATGNSYAAKCMYGKGPDTRAMMRHELDIMNQLHDRHLIRARDGFENKNSLTIVTDLAGGGELFDNICKQSALTESDIAHYIRQVLWGLDHMHDKGIAHLGLTPGDILLSKPGGDDIKICDFGLANRIVKGKDFYMDYGMPEFVAPEIVHHRPVSFPADMWSVGVITYLLLSGISPFLGDTDRETLRRIQKGQLTFDPEIFTMVSDEAKDFISKLLVFDSQGRLDVKAALKHPWLRFADNLGSGNMIDTDRLRNYYRRYKDWVRNSACDRYYRRRPLKSAYEDPSGMIYPPGERYTPPSSPESTPTPRTKHDFEAPKFADNVDREHEDLNYDLGYADSTSRYQNGPDTYLLQLRDVGFPLRLREYMRVSAERSPTLGMKFQDTFSGQAVTVRERRRFTDVMDEEIDDEKQGQLDGVKRRIRSEINPRSETKNRIKELLPNSHKEELAPYFREKLQDVAFSDEQEVELSCLAIGEPKPVITWYRNDVLMSESHRVKFSEDAKGRSFIRFNPAKAFDAGLYKAVARNVAGETACRARLRKGEIPGKVDAPLVAQTSDTEALVTWHYPKMDGHSQITGYGLEFKELDEPSWHEVASNITHQFMVAKNLQPGRRYVFRVRASNGFGCGDYSGPSQTAETLESGAQKVTISRAMKYQQELTELGKAVDASVRRRSLDYAVEENPVPISNGVPTEKYNFVSEISRGRFSLVVKCCQRDGDEVFAAKLLEVTPSTEASIKNEYEVFKRLRHERIPCLREAFSYNSIFVLVEEKLQGFDVLTYLTRNPSYSEDVVTRIVTQVLDALEYLHFRSIVHLDVQPDNVVVSNLSNAQVKLVDFGSAKLLSKFEIQKGDKRGNHEFMAPEVFNQEDLTVQADIWSTGVLAYVLLSGVSPFRGVTTQETAQNITFVRYRFEHLYKEITPEATRFLMAIFKKTPQKRPTADECLEQKWLNPSELLLKKRERAIFGSSKLRQYADEYHKQRQNVATTSEKLLGAFGMQFSRSVSVEYDTMTTF